MTQCFFCKREVAHEHTLYFMKPNRFVCAREECKLLLENYELEKEKRMLVDKINERFMES